MATHSKRKNAPLNPISFLKFFTPVLALLAFSSAPSFAYDNLLPPMPESEFISLSPDEPTVDFCSEWNPEFNYRGGKCCSDQYSRNLASKRRQRSLKSRCAPERTKWTFCDEMTEGQKNYVQDVKSGQIKDVLAWLEQRFESRGKQVFCGASNGFLVGGKPLIPSELNRIEIRNPARCSNFGTDRMVAMMEWIGREVSREYHEKDFDRSRIIVGDLSAPRGSCISGRYGRRAHKSHTTGLDIDVAFFNPVAKKNPEERFTRNFYVASNWWFVKHLFKNPYACVKVIFVDQKHIRMLKHYAKKSGDSDWEKLQPHIRHIKGHKDHFHVRIGEKTGGPGCIGEAPVGTDEEISDADAEEMASAETSKPEADSEANDDSTEETLAEKTAEVLRDAVQGAVDKATGVKNANAGLDEYRLAHKQEPAITQRLMAELRPAKRRKKKNRGVASHKVKSKKKRR